MNTIGQVEQRSFYELNSQQPLQILNFSEHETTASNRLGRIGFKTLTEDKSFINQEPLNPSPLVEIDFSKIRELNDGLSKYLLKKISAGNPSLKRPGEEFLPNPNKKPKTEGTTDNEKKQRVEFGSGFLLYYFCCNGVKHGPAKEVRLEKYTESFNFVDNQRHGKATRKWVDGDILRFNYNQGRKEGKATQTWLKTGKLEFFYRDGIKHGLARRIGLDGTILTLFYYEGIPVGQARQELKDKSFIEFTYINGHRQGAAFKIWPNGNRLDFSYLDDQRNGKATQSFEKDHQLEFTYKMGLRQGEAHEVFSNGKILTFIYVDSVRQGSAIEWLVDGSIVDFTYLNGVPHGVARQVWPDLSECLQFFDHGERQKNLIYIKDGVEYHVEFGNLS